MRNVALLLATLFLVAATVQKTTRLSKDLKEISGLVFANDTTLIAHNDGGNDPELFVLNLDGSIRHKVTITNAENEDFEDIALDSKGNLYIGDFGNNNNKRTDLKILKVSLQKVLDNQDVEAKFIEFSYPEQTTFPPTLKEKYFDCEAMSFYNDSLYLFTKCRTEPFDGKCFVYTLPTNPGTYKANKKYYLIIGKRDWFRDAITGADIRENKLVLLTYNRIIVHSFENGRPKYESHNTLLPITQKEAIAIHSSGRIYVADERQKIIGGGNLYVIKPAPSPNIQQRSTEKKK
ncbi:hypothetical protein [Fluviicola taffensis]|uniref:Uncharacterized protein n=1 Tax=Fluviicola taffensis (strain DSM 16823 / NCIMB 13979 / RW262) TaxID=755732 RepID=F2IGQ1_FLUTR|nr:hypothetical protein [Fluviicola taffensis]AEA43668.1 hypothetical protein Fluta_1676 [Fluviicola taffensis DSM 16823]